MFGWIGQAISKWKARKEQRAAHKAARREEELYCQEYWRQRDEAVLRRNTRVVRHQPVPLQQPMSTFDDFYEARY